MGARWILGCLVRLAAAGCVERATFMPPHGGGGFLREDQVTPTEELFRVLAGHDNVTRIEVNSDGDLAVDVLQVTSGGGRSLLVGHDAEFDLEMEIPFQGNGGPLGGRSVPFAGGKIALPPRAVWQLRLHP
jgi:hypothetical protein